MPGQGIHTWKMNALTEDRILEKKGTISVDLEVAFNEINNMSTNILHPSQEATARTRTTTNLPHGTGDGSLKNPNRQEVEPADNSTILARESIRLAFWNTRGIGPKHGVKHRLLSDLGASILLLNEQWKSLTSPRFKIEEKRDRNLPSIKFNTSTWIEVGINYIRHFKLEHHNTIILEFTQLKL